MLVAPKSKALYVASWFPLRPKLPNPLLEIVSLENLLSKIACNATRLRQSDAASLLHKRQTTGDGHGARLGDGLGDYNRPRLQFRGGYDVVHQAVSLRLGSAENPPGQAEFDRPPFADSG